MTGGRAFPRLRTADTLAILEQMRDSAKKNPELLKEMVAFDHPRADAVPTGAAIASSEDVRHVREFVVEQLDEWLTGKPVGRDSTVRFDTALGRSLHESLQILPADAAHDETWNFLSAVVFPDVVWTRYPDLHQDRVLGKRHRNTLRRAWFRFDVIGDLQVEAAVPLGEDEMTGLFERSQVSRDRDLVRTLTKMILGSSASSRSQYARDLMKQVTALTGTFLLDGLHEQELQERIVSLTAGPRGMAPFPVAVSTSVTPQPTDDSSSRPSALESRRETGSSALGTRDLVATFHQAMIDLCATIYREVGHDPTVLIRMISQLGGLEAARSVVGAARPSDTFTKLFLRGRQDLSVEALILEERFKGLFSQTLLDRAAERLGRA